jgi:hypothetical protein
MSGGYYWESPDAGDLEPHCAVVGGPVSDGSGYTGHVSDSPTGLS